MKVLWVTAKPATAALVLGLLLVICSIFAFMPDDALAQSREELRAYSVMYVYPAGNVCYVNRFFRDPFFHSIGDMCEWYFNFSVGTKQAVSPIVVRALTKVKYTPMQVQCEALNGPVIFAQAKVIDRSSPHFGVTVFTMYRDIDSSRSCATMGDADRQRARAC